MLTVVLSVTTVSQDRKETRVTKENEDLPVLLDPKGIEALKVGQMFQEMLLLVRLIQFNLLTWYLSP